MFFTLSCCLVLSQASIIRVNFSKEENGKKQRNFDASSLQCVSYELLLLSDKEEA